MDSDGEDDPSKINEMINEAERNLDCVVTSNRTSRKESLIFKILYMFHKLLTFVLSLIGLVMETLAASIQKICQIF